MSKKRPEKNERTRTYWVWAAMLDRCRNPNSPQYKDYGGRGITVCERWKSSANFFADMGIRPSPKHSLDRRDNSKGYSPDNCEWTTRDVQNKNKRLYRKNRHGIAGVTQVGDKFRVRIRVNTKMIELKRVNSLEEAAQIREAALAQYGFSGSHGKVA